MIAGVDRCAAALEDLALLADAVAQLREHPEPTAQFAAALFDLERARRGDLEARAQLSQVAEELLVFWRERSGDGLADAHPALGPLWTQASALLISFEVKGFKRALDACWEARGDAARLQAAIVGLAPAGNRRVEFAACLYHLELARLLVDSSRGEFARRASLVHEAYHSKETADELVADDPGLQHLWKELVPYLDEFFEALEAEQERKLRSNLKTDPGGEAVSRTPTSPSLAAVTVVGPAPVAKDSAAVSDATVVMEAIDLSVPPPLPAASVPDSSGVFEMWVQEPNRPSAPQLAVTRRLDIPDPDVTAPQPPPGPPPSPPPNTTPVPGRRPVGSDSGILDLQDIVEEPQALPPRPRRPSLDVEMGDYEPDEAAQIFWRHTEKALGLLPPADAPRMDRRALSAESRADRKKLTNWLEGVSGRFEAVPESQAFACLMKLFLAAQLKDKGLFGGANAKRKEAFVSALGLLSAEPLAAGHCAVWFELDGKETLEHLGNGLEVLTDYLQFCARQNLDPLDPLVPSQFMA